jgi:hypothetical protein
VTAELGRRWNFPDDLVSAFRHASDPLLVDPFPRLAAQLGLAATMADAGDLGIHPVDAVMGVDPESLRRLGVDPLLLAAGIPSFAEHVQPIDLLA